MRAYQNPDWTDAQREREYQNKIDEQYDRCAPNWRFADANTREQKAAILIENLKPEDEVDLTVVANVLLRDETGEKYPCPTVVKKDDDGRKFKKQFQLIQIVSSTIRKVRRNKTLRFVAPIYTEHSWNKNGDVHNMLNDAKAKRKVDLQIRDQFCEKLEMQARSMNETAQIIRENSEIPDKEKQRIKAEEIRRRKQRKVIQ
jgi:hypothetical protein